VWESGCVWVRRSCDAADIVMKSSYFLLCPGSAVRENHMAIDDHKWQTCRNCRVPAMYLTSANLLFLTFFAFNEINKLCIIGEAQNSDSPRLHQFSPVVRCAKNHRLFNSWLPHFNSSHVHAVICLPNFFARKFLLPINNPQNQNRRKLSTGTAF